MAEEIGGRYEMFVSQKLTDVSVDSSIEQGGKEGPCLFSMMMNSMIVVLSESWR